MPVCVSTIVKVARRRLEWPGRDLRSLGPAAPGCVPMQSPRAGARSLSVRVSQSARIASRSRHAAPSLQPCAAHDQARAESGGLLTSGIRRWQRRAPIRICSLQRQPGTEAANPAPSAAQDARDASQGRGGLRRPTPPRFTDRIGNSVTVEIVHVGPRWSWARASTAARGRARRAGA